MGQPPTRCPRCEVTWTGSVTCHCGACHRTFSGVKLFDLHRRGGRCSGLEGHAELRLVDGIWRYPERDPATLPEAV